MSRPDNCPHCGSVSGKNGWEYSCGYAGLGSARTAACHKTEVDKLAALVVQRQTKANQLADCVVQILAVYERVGTIQKCDVIRLKYFAEECRK